jgi:hypothetical protein
MKVLDKIVGVKILRPIILPLIGVFMVFYIIADYVFNIEE